MRTFLSFFSLSLLLVLSSCKGPSYYYKMGMKQETSGLNQEASESYYTALLKKRNYVEAQLAMKRTGQSVLNQKLAEFGRKKAMATAKEAVYAYQEVTAYKDRISAVGVQLEIAEMYKQEYDEVKQEYINQLYEEGTALLEQEQYKDAEVKFKELAKFDPNFKNAKDLGDIAYLEPLYKEGKNGLETEKYRTAYQAFSKVIERKPDYKDAKELKKRALEKGTFTVALMPFVNGTNRQGLEARVSAYTLEALLSIKDPFLKVVDREHMMAILQEQKLQLSGVVDDATAVEVGKISGAHAILTGTVMNYNEYSGQLRTYAKTAYESYSEKHVNQADGKVWYETKYRPVNYTEYSNNNSCSVNFQFKLVSVATGELLKTEIFEKKVEDQVQYATCSLSANNLYPGGQGNAVITGGEQVKQFRAMFSARQNLTPAADLSNDAFKSLTKQMSQDIATVLQEIVR